MNSSNNMTAILAETDPEISQSIQYELERQQHQIELIASENFVSPAVLAAQGCIMTNKYAEGYPGRRYYGGCEFVDMAENLAINRLKDLFGCRFANVQPHSGSQANQAVFLTLLNPGDTILGLDLSAGGHLTHGSPVNISGKWFNIVAYGVDEKTHLINYDQVEELAKTNKPKLIIAGGSAYPRTIDFARFRSIADSIGATLLVDMAHFAGLVAGGAYPSPIPHAHVVTSTTHKTLRGPRGGIILTNDEALAKKINSAIFPGLQGGPLMHVIAAKAVAFKEALNSNFREYAHRVVTNAQHFSDRLLSHNFDLISGGTDSHVILVDLRSKGVTGKDACIALEHVNITCNKNGIPNDPASPMITSGIRLGTPAMTTRGFGQEEFTQVADWIHQTIDSLAKGEQPNPIIKNGVHDLCKKFPLYPELGYC